MTKQEGLGGVFKPTPNGKTAGQTPDAPTAPDVKPANRSRSRKRRNVIGGSPHRAEYVRLMEAGWSSSALEKYASFRYGEDIPASTFREYKKRRGIEGPVTLAQDVDDLVDVMSVRADLIRLQQERIGIDVAHEREMRKLFGATKGEMQLLSGLLDAHKRDLQDLGLFPKAGESLTITNAPSEAGHGVAPRAATLGDLFGADPEAEMELAKVLHMRQRSQEATG